MTLIRNSGSFCGAQMLDAIVTYLKSEGKPVERNRLARALYAQGCGPDAAHPAVDNHEPANWKSDSPLREQSRLARLEEDSRVRL